MFPAALVFKKVIITRKDFERKIFPALQQCVDCAARVLDRAGESTNPQIEILLTGGSSYIPLVRTLLEQKFPHLAKDHILQRFPEQAVALGCALYANRQLSDTPVAYAYALRVRLPGSGQQKLKVQIPPMRRFHFRSAEPTQHIPQIRLLPASLFSK